MKKKRMDATFNVRVPDEWLEPIHEISTRECRNVQGTIRLAIREYMERNGLIKRP